RVETIATAIEKIRMSATRTAAPIRLLRMTDVTRTRIECVGLPAWMPQGMFVQHSIKRSGSTVRLLWRAWRSPNAGTARRRPGRPSGDVMKMHRERTDHPPGPDDARREPTVFGPYRTDQTVGNYNRRWVVIPSERQWMASGLDHGVERSVL